jgi:hypothetical protein
LVNFAPQKTSITAAGIRPADFPEAMFCGVFAAIFQNAECGHRGYRRSVPLTTMSTSRPPHCEHTSRSRHSRTSIFAPYRRACSARIGLELMLASLAPHDQADAGSLRAAKSHRRAGLGFHPRHQELEQIIK